MIHKLTFCAPYGEFETSINTLSGSTYTVWQFTVFLVPL